MDLQSFGAILRLLQTLVRLVLTKLDGSKQPHTKIEISIESNPCKVRQLVDQLSLQTTTYR